MENNRGCSRRTLCIAISGAILVLVLIALILSWTMIFKVKPPSTKVNSITPRNITVALDLARLQVHVNLTLSVDLSLKNPNRASFEYASSSAVLSYHDKVVGEAPILAGEVSSSETKRMELTLTVMADQVLLLNSAVIGDLAVGRMVFSSYSRLSGKVKFLGAIKVPGVTTARCEFSLFLGNNMIGEQSCVYKSEL